MQKWLCSHPGDHCKGGIGCSNVLVWLKSYQRFANTLGRDDQGVADLLIVDLLIAY
jgi:hypothetical protein